MTAPPAKVRNVILEGLQELSAPFGTRISIVKGIGHVRL